MLWFRCCRLFCCFSFNNRFILVQSRGARSVSQRLDATVIKIAAAIEDDLLDAGGVMVINPGSVGLPRDGDWRASYAVWEDGKVTLKRVEYDVERAVRSVEESPLPDLAKLMLMQVLRHGSLNGPAKSNGNGAAMGKTLTG